MIFNGMSRKKITVLPGRPIVPFGVWCPGFVPTLRHCVIPPCFLCPSAALCLRVGGRKLAHILSVYTKKSLAAGAPLGELTTLHPNLQVGPERLEPAALTPHPTTRALVPNCGAQIMVTLVLTDISLRNVVTSKHLSEMGGLKQLGRLEDFSRLTNTDGSGHWQRRGWRHCDVIVVLGSIDGFQGPQ